MTLSIQYPKKLNPRIFKTIDWDLFTQDIVKMEYNEALAKLCHDNPPNSLALFNELMLMAAKEIATREKIEDAGWYQTCKPMLKPLLDERNNVLFAARKAECDLEYWKRRCKETRKSWDEGVKVAIAQWAHKVVVDIHNMPSSPKRAWEGIKLLQKGLQSHHKPNQTMKFKREDGTYSKNDSEHSDLLEPHFFKVFNRNPKIDESVFDEVKQYPVIVELDAPLTFKEFQDSVIALCWHKAPGLNKVVPNAIKALDDENLFVLYEYIKTYIETDEDFDEWKVSHLVPLPKKGDLSNPNNWRGINLLDVTSKLVSIIVNKRLQKMLKIRGITHQFGASPGTGCQNGLFCLKTLLQTRREHNLDSYCVFIHLVKAYDSIQHEIITLALVKMGVPDRLCKVVQKLYSNFNVVPYARNC